ncbi:HD domain-containing protein [Harryflintia acetispora]|uniref:HD domain-containing protein n=1 Tax=Harryflintia acetispora TaxID=1849041 RepID=A0A9X8UJI6_9FIRM|nr:HD domain-containing protein [Harryflintia acetispora]TCL43701.1 HD domain-containing protein [Harryflintia acetispora]
MTTGALVEKMIAFYNGNLHDINHFLKVHAYAKTIGELEGLDPLMQRTLEVAAIVHDIACPLCREKYGNTNGKRQEEHGEALAREFLDGTGCPDGLVERVCYLVAHHHTYTNVDGMDYQILLEADFLVNADESGMGEKAILNTLQKVFKTRSGIRLLKEIYQVA